MAQRAALSASRAFGLTGLSGLIATAEVVLDAVSDGMALVLEAPPKQRSSASTSKELCRLLLQRLDARRIRSTGINEHLVRGLLAHSRQDDNMGMRHGPRPRLADLILMHCREAGGQTDDNGTSDWVLVPSPFYVAIEALTIPEDIHTRAYAILAYRMILSRHFKVWPHSSFSSEIPKHCTTLTEAQVVTEIRRIRTFLEHRDNRSARTDIKQFVSHFVAAKGVLHLRFRKKAAARFLRSHSFTRRKALRGSQVVLPEFRLSRRYVELPEAATFINELLGVPIPIRGADTIFFNGLKPSADHNLVVEVSGGPGTGKTSLSLALAASLAPFDTFTLYLSLEENEDDLRSKLASLSQPRLRRLSFTHGDGTHWFWPRRVPEVDLDDFEEKVLNELNRKLTTVRKARARALAAAKLIPPIPLMVVVDSLSAIRLTSGQAARRQRLIRFVNKCRDLGALTVIVTSAKGEDRRDISEALDYLVDIVTTLRVKDSEDHSSKPIRLFTLSKSRHQIARHGTHVFHLSGESGFRFAPQLPSQMDAQSSLAHMLWDKNSHIKALNVYREGKSKYQYREFVSIPVRSHILIHGFGSTGKAGLALKCAFAPRFNPDGYDGDRLPRVLVISFLYPEPYYDELRRRILNRLSKETSALGVFGFNQQASERFVAESQRIGFVHFSPGFLSAEDLYSKVVRALEAARLEGRPYTSVIVDGLHNLALQFPGARDTDVLWPILYGTLSRSNVTTITTFTTLELAQIGRTPQSSLPEDSQFRLRTHLPLMHALVQASDYVIEVSRSKTSEHYEAWLRTAVDKEPPADPLLWERTSLEFVAARKQPASKGGKKR